MSDDIQIHYPAPQSYDGPVMLTPALMTWVMAVGNSATLTAPTYAGAPSTVLWTLLRDNVAVAGQIGVNEAAAEAYLAVQADVDATSVTWAATVTNASGNFTSIPPGV